MREILIHLLGGYTAKEYTENSWRVFEDGKLKGKRFIAHKVVNYAKSIYGCPAEEWCNKMYKELNNLLNN